MIRRNERKEKKIRKNGDESEKEELIKENRETGKKKSYGLIDESVKYVPISTSRH